MSSTCLVTGGAGFIGCALAPDLLASYDRVVVLDNLHPQVHPQSGHPEALAEGVELRVGDVVDAGVWDDLLADVRPTTVIHLAAETGTGQSLTEATRHASVNVVGTSQMLDAFVRHDALPDTVVLTSSRAVYGEGAWRQADGTIVYPGQRSDEMLTSATWDFPGLTPTPFEASRVAPSPTSVYGATKLAQEHLVSSWCLSMNVKPVLFRLQNVYGLGQSLINPYTGIVSFFAQAARSGQSIPVYEDGNIVRDFVYIDDVASAITAGVRSGRATTHPLDVGSGVGTTIADLAAMIAAVYGAPTPHVNGRYRNGDVRHASCDISATTDQLDWTPQVSVEEGVRRLCEWIDEHHTLTGG